MLNPVEVAKQTDAPSQNDEPVFKTPWEARIFAMTAHLAAQNGFEWDAFRDKLIAEIGKGDEIGDVCDDTLGTPYYRSWLAASEDLMSAMGACTTEELERRIAQLSDPLAAGKTSPTGRHAAPVSES